MKRSFSFAMFCSAALLAACASTTFTSTWKAPDVQAFNPKGRKVAVVFISNDESIRRVAEDTLVRKLKEQGAQGIATYTIIPSDELGSMDRVKARFAQAGADGIVTMRVIDERQRVTYTEPSPTFAPYYWNFSRYWGYGWGAPYEPGRISTETEVVVETLIYSLNRDQLVWAGTSRTINPSQVDEFIDEVADAAAREMKRQGLLA